jgi:phosphoribosylformylglycinamidine cyclo-ligase
MRAPQQLTYRVEQLPPVPAVLEFLVAEAQLDPAAAYSTFNMGAGFAVYCQAGAGEAVVAAASSVGLAASVSGTVQEGPRGVVLEPLGVTFSSEQLELSARRE